MIIVDALLDTNDVLRDISVKGHSGYGVKGADIVCASVSCLVETSYILLKKLLLDKVQLKTNICTKDKNEMEFEIVDYPLQLKEQLIGVTSFLLTGLTQIQKQYTENIKININLR